MSSIIVTKGAPSGRRPPKAKVVGSILSGGFLKTWDQGMICIAPTTCTNTAAHRNSSSWYFSHPESDTDCSISQSSVSAAIDSLRRAANDDTANVFAEVVNAAEIGVTHGEIISALREELGFGHPLIVE